jgi:glycosyltransferase A (GT-A) superfamily protein (DUF2064 family)
LYEALLLDTIDLAYSLPDLSLAVAISPASALPYFMKITPPRTHLLPIEGLHIGDCLKHAVRSLFSAGFKKVLALNADGPSLPRTYIMSAIRLLADHNIVLGPGEDGGYYLIGMDDPYDELFQDIPWSTPEVLQKTLAQAEILGLRAACTSPWYDVDSAVEAFRLMVETTALPSDRLGHTRRYFSRHFM